MKTQISLSFEEALWAHDVDLVAGVDEAGRGPWAGPVVAAAVCFDPDFIRSASTTDLAGLTDSKKLTEKQREYYFEKLLNRDGVFCGVGQADRAEIDSMNILRATHLAMARALANLPIPPNHVLVDGRPVKSLVYASTAIIKGDAKSFSIAAASVVAKVTRDRILVALDRQYPVYGFARHKGYGTKAHQAALAAHGPCDCHRRSFKPIARFFEPNLFEEAGS